MVRDNVFVYLTDIHTGEVTEIESSHNIALTYMLTILPRWLAGVNNTGYNATEPPTQIELGSGAGTPQVTDTGLFTPIPAYLTSLSYVQMDTPSAGSITLVFQIPAGVVSGQVTEALLRDTSANPWSHTMFPAPFTPVSTQTITVKWVQTATHA